MLGRLYLRGKTRYTFYTRLSGSQDQLDTKGYRKISTSADTRERLLLFNIGHIVQLWSETVVVRRRIIYGGHIITADKCWGKTPKKPQPVYWPDRGSNPSPLLERQRWVHRDRIRAVQPVAIRFNPNFRIRIKICNVNKYTLVFFLIVFYVSEAANLDVRSCMHDHLRHECYRYGKLEEEITVLWLGGGIVFEILYKRSVTDFVSRESSASDKDRSLQVLVRRNPNFNNTVLVSICPHFLQVKLWCDVW